MRWLLDHGADVNAKVAADYVYLPRHLAPGYGHEVRLQAGSTALRLVAAEYKRAKRGGTRYRPALELIKARGTKSSSLPAKGMAFFPATSALGIIPFAIAFFAGLLLDARITGWHALSQRFAATAEPANLYARQTGGVGTVVWFISKASCAPRPTKAASTSLSQNS